MSDTIDINVNKIVETIDVFANFEHPNIEINTIEIVDNVEVNATPNVVQININSINGDVEWGEIQGVLLDQTDLQQALDLKANTSDLSAVAFSNDYNDLYNLPSIQILALDTSGFGDDVSYNPTAKVLTIDKYDWVDLARGYTVEPTLFDTTATYEVYEYIYTSITLYRKIMNDNSEDAFYDSPTLATKLCEKKISL